jgi:glycosyltransferase involved in cell wall biosynthesis
VRIGLVVPGFSADQTDWCIPALRHLTRTLATAEDVRVISVRYPYRAARYAVDRAEVIALGGADCRGRGTLHLWRTALDAVRDEHRRRPFDVLHAFWATESGLLTAVAGRMLRIPTLVSLAGGELVALPEVAYGDQRIAWERLKVRASLRLASAVSAGSRQLQQLATRHVRGRAVHRAPLGVDLSLFNPKGAIRPRLPRLVHVGTLTGVKDQTTLLHAFAGLRQQGTGARLDVFGDGPLWANLDRVSAQLGMSDVVHFHGAVDHAALQPIYRAGSAFVLSSRHEAQGMAAIEAAACGMPVVGTRVGVLPELTAALAPIGDNQALARCLASVLNDPEPHAQTALDRARSDFSLGDSANRFRRLYAALSSVGGH